MSKIILTWDLFLDLDEVAELQVLGGDGAPQYARVRFKYWVPRPSELFVYDPESVEAIKSYLASEGSRPVRLL